MLLSIQCSSNKFGASSRIQIRLENLLRYHCNIASGLRNPNFPPIVGHQAAYRRAECYLTPHLLSSFRTEDRSDSVTSLL